MALPPPPGLPAGDLPPPPRAPDATTSRSPSRDRPGWVTAAGTILIVLGAVGVLGGLIVALSRDAMGIEELAPRDAVVAIGIVSMVLSGAEVAAGVLVLRLSNAGRVMGLTLAGLGVLGGIASFGSVGVTSAVGLVLNGLVLYALIAYARAFGPGGRG